MGKPKKHVGKAVPPFKQIACSSPREITDPTLYGLDKKGRCWVLDSNGYWYPVETRLAPE